MKFGNEFWQILFQEYISPKLFEVCLPSLLGDEDKGIEIVYGEKKIFVLGPLE
jgi:hypothetical protein